jgi:citrate lyase subunit beta/citryl-CoA lyase
VLSRSNLIVPLSNGKFLAKAHLRGADQVTLDLEDGVAPSAKAAARERLAEAVAMVSRGGAQVRVRLNRPLDLLVRDIEAAVIPGVAMLGIAKVESAGHVRLVSQFVGELEAARGLPPGGIRLSASLETPAALQQAYEIAAADPRLVSIGLGSLDIAAACEFEPSAESLYFPKQVVMYAARAAGIGSGGYLGSIADYTDLDALRAIVRRSKKLGFRGGSAIHPAQVPVLNEEFAPGAAEVDEAREIVALAEAAFARGDGAFAYRGRMIDKPVVAAAQATLRLAAAVAEHEARTRRLQEGA